MLVVVLAVVLDFELVCFLYWDFQAFPNFVTESVLFVVVVIEVVVVLVVVVVVV